MAILGSLEYFPYTHVLIIVPHIDIVVITNPMDLYYHNRSYCSNMICPWGEHLSTVSGKQPMKKLYQDITYNNRWIFFTANTMMPLSIKKGYFFLKYIGLFSLFGFKAKISVLNKNVM